MKPAMEPVIRIRPALRPTMSFAEALAANLNLLFWLSLVPFVIRWIGRSSSAFVLSRVVKYVRSPQGRATINRNLSKLRRH